jgi:hypothetical protein
MTLSDSLSWSFARSILVAAIAIWPVLLLTRRIAAARTVGTRRTWLILAVLPFFIPELLIGFNYRLTATQLSVGASAGLAAVATELLYGLLQLVRCMAVGVALSLLLPRSEVTREALHSWNLLRTSRTLTPWEWRRGWVQLRLAGPWQPILVSWSLMALVVFQEFETAALMQIDRHPIAWSVWLFDAHAAGQPLTSSLRMIVLPLLCELVLLSPALLMLLRGRRPNNPAAELPSEEFAQTNRESAAQRALPSMMVVPGLVLFLLWPLAMNAATTIGGMALMFRGPLLSQAGTAILASTAFSFGSTFIAMTLAWHLCRIRFGRRKSLRSLSGIGAVALVVPGLAGSLVLSLLLVAAFQSPALRTLYDTWLPMLIGQSLAVLPRALCVVLLLVKTTDSAAIHSARLLAAANDARRQWAASALLWRLTTGRWLLGGLVIAHWCFWDVTSASVLHPVQFEPVVTRLYNEMHYGRTEALMSLSVLAATTPLAAAGCAMFISRILHTRKKNSPSPNS